jgi:hypothetical protein
MMFVSCALMMIMTAPRKHCVRALLCPGFSARKVDRTADSGRLTAAGSARIEGRAAVITADS